QDEGDDPPGAQHQLEGPGAQGPGHVPAAAAQPSEAVVAAADLAPGELPEPSRARRHEPPDLAVRHVPEALDGPAGVAQPAQVPEVPPPGGHDVAGVAPAADEERVRRLEDVEDDQAGHGPQQSGGAVGGQDDADAVPLLEPSPVVD